MAGTKKETGPSAKRVAANMRVIRRGRNVTTLGLSKRLDAIGYPLGDTGITKREQGLSRVDVDDLVPIALGLGVTPNTLLMPPVDFLGSGDFHHLTPLVGGNPERLWQWAQGERPADIDVPGSDAWLGEGKDPALQFSIRTRPYLTAVHRITADDPIAVEDANLKSLSRAVLEVMAEGAPPEVVRRVVELTIAMVAEEKGAGK